MDGGLSHLSLCGPVMDWQPVQGVPCLLPNESCNRLLWPWVGLSGYWKWMWYFREVLGDFSCFSSEELLYGDEMKWSLKDTFQQWLNPTMYYYTPEKVTLLHHCCKVVYFFCWSNPLIYFKCMTAITMLSLYTDLWSYSLKELPQYQREFLELVISCSNPRLPRLSSRSTQQVGWLTVYICCNAVCWCFFLVCTIWTTTDMHCTQLFLK